MSYMNDPYFAFRKGRQVVIRQNADKAWQVEFFLIGAGLEKLESIWWSDTFTTARQESEDWLGGEVIWKQIGPLGHVYDIPA